MRLSQACLLGIQLCWNNFRGTKSFGLFFTRAADLGMQNCRGQLFQLDFLLPLLQRQGLATLAGLKRALAFMATVSPAISYTMLGGGFTDKWLQVVNRPGAYLLDTVYTMLQILSG